MLVVSAGELQSFFNPACFASMTQKIELHGLLGDLLGMTEDNLTTLTALAKNAKESQASRQNAKICVVEGEDRDDFLPGIAVHLTNHHPQFNLCPAANSAETFDLLANDPGIVLIIIDLSLPKLEGFKVLARLLQDFSHLPVVVLTDQGVPPALEKLLTPGNLTILAHSLALNNLWDVVNSRLTMKNSAGCESYSLGVLASLLEMEGKTTLMAISSGTKSGSCFIREGQPIDAICGNKRGEQAIRELLAWRKCEILFTDFSDKKIKRMIKQTVLELVGSDSAGSESLKTVDGLSQAGIGETFIIAAKKNPETRLSAPLGEKIKEKEAGVVLHDVGLLVDPQNLREELVMALENFLEKFKKINGYKASAIMNFTGEILAQDSIDPNIDLGLVGATFNDIFRTAHEASDKIGLEACREAAISTPKGIIIMRCSGVKSKVHYHIIAIFNADGNQALAKMEMEKMIPLVMEELA